MLIQNSPRFIEDYENYQKRISQVTDENLKNQLTDTLVKLKEHIQYIDRSHEQIFFTGKIPTDEIAENRNQVADYKKQLDSRLLAWEQERFLKPGLHPNAE
jgi:aspartyl/asparaginyl beta-hydroxylase (cupin superfamily)